MVPARPRLHCTPTSRTTHRLFHETRRKLSEMSRAPRNPCSRILILTRISAGEGERKERRRGRETREHRSHKSARPGGRQLNSSLGGSACPPGAPRTDRRAPRNCMPARAICLHCVAVLIHYPSGKVTPCPLRSFICSSSIIILGSFFHLV